MSDELFNEFCKVDGCGVRVKCKGYCGRHYHKLVRYGDPEGGAKWRRGGRKAWLDSIIGKQTDSCIIWPFPERCKGYGGVRHAGRQIGAHRYVCIEAHGGPPTLGHEAAHDCGNSLCCNPRHISWKTHAENIADKERHGTNLLGEAHPQSKLTESDVLKIRALRGAKTRRDIAASFGVARATIDNVLDGATWSHV